MITVGYTTVMPAAAADGVISARQIRVACPRSPDAGCYSSSWLTCCLYFLSSKPSLYMSSAGPEAHFSTMDRAHKGQNIA